MSIPAAAINPQTGKARMAIYLQDAHPIREGMEYDSSSILLYGRTDVFIENPFDFFDDL